MKEINFETLTAASTATFIGASGIHLAAGCFEHPVADKVQTAATKVTMLSGAVTLLCTAGSILTAVCKK